MHVEHRERKGEREARGDFVGYRQGAQTSSTLRPCASASARSAGMVYAPPAGGVAKAFVQLAPGDRHAISARRRVAISAWRAFGEHGRFDLADEVPAVLRVLW